MSNRNPKPKWAATAIAVLVRQRLSIDRHRSLDYDRKLAEDDHGEVSGEVSGEMSSGSVVGGELAVVWLTQAGRLLEEAERPAKVSPHR